MLVIDAAMWPGGDPTESETVGQIVIGQVARSAGGDFADYLVVHVEANLCATSALMLQRRHVMAGWRDLLWAALDGEGATPVEVDDPRVAKVIANLRQDVAPSD
ncbi:hypothetical protein K8W59_19640 [Nocardioides rotundus]|uniref:hypothetical protein n=1 Tax=Nocardioides rotundus TaxID=1774216 RepID=UPI001CBF108A|nr:hypothetical protein [Nocardioides rotundus]UAL29904.1 hypothetical protein K8W59_19640 [Nocardioides rotundus]